MTRPNMISPPPQYPGRNQLSMSSSSDYPIRCIIPSERYWIVANKSPLETQEPTDDMNNAHSHTITYYNKQGTKLILPCDEIGSMFCFEYIQRLVFLHEKEFRECIYQTVDNHDNDWFSRIRQKLQHNVTHADVSLKYIGILDGFDVGHGVFAEQFIPAGSYVGEYVGLVSSINETTVRDDHYNFQYPCCDGGLEINGREYGNLMRFINHSATPNSEFRAVKLDEVMHVVCVTALDLAPGTQLTVDYGGAFWMRQKMDPLAILEPIIS